jgi:hypothetical protein
MFSTHLRQESFTDKLFYWLSKAGVAAVIDPKGMSIPTLKSKAEQYEITHI